MQGLCTLEIMFDNKASVMQHYNQDIMQRSLLALAHWTLLFYDRLGLLGVKARQKSNGVRNKTTSFFLFSFLDVSGAVCVF